MTLLISFHSVHAFFVVTIIHTVITNGIHHLGLTSKHENMRISRHKKLETSCTSSLLLSPHFRPSKMFHSKSPVTQPGHGMITLTSDPSNRAIFSTLAYTYPLKLQTPTRYFGEKLAVVFMLSYGGGFLGGDEVDVKIRVEEGTGLVVCTQGSHSPHNLVVPLVP